MSKGTAGSSSPRLSRDLIVRSALELIDRSGAHGLSMRALGQQLDVEAMSLYRYVHGKEDLLEGVVALLMSDLTAALEREEGQHWQAFLQLVAHEVRRIASDHPLAFPLVATRHPAAPWLRPPAAQHRGRQHVPQRTDRGRVHRRASSKRLPILQQLPPRTTPPGIVSPRSPNRTGRRTTRRGRREHPAPRREPLPRQRARSETAPLPTERRPQ